MKIVQITDIHLAFSSELSRNVDVVQNFTDILVAVKLQKPDLIVLGGDLAYKEANTEVYSWIKMQLDKTGIDYRVIPGNHDSSKLLSNAFGLNQYLQGSELYWQEDFGKKTLIFLDTAVGLVSDQQLDWLRLKLSKLKSPVVIFMHHPPLIGGVPHMDTKWKLNNMEAIQEVLFEFQGHISIFCGHYHVEKTLAIKNLTVQITPSTFFQMKWHSPEFEIDHYRIAYREIILREDEAVESTVVYLEGNTL
jgi:Icc protein